MCVQPFLKKQHRTTFKNHLASQVLLPLIFLSCYTFTVLPALSALRQTHACSRSNASTAKPMAFALSHTLAPTSGIISPKTSGYSLFLQNPTQDISLLRIFQLNHIVLHSYQSVQYVCVCACVRACVRACACVRVHLLHNYA